MPLDESVLCIPTAHVRAIGYFHGLRPADAAYQTALLDPKQYSFHPRAEVETDPTFKQLIPYVVLTCGEQVFHYRRGAAGGEKRLQALRSIGIGGHISVADAAGGTDPYRTGMLREVTEEVDLGSAFVESLLGFILDDRTPVGTVHLGVVHRFEMTRASAMPREAALAEAGWALGTQLRAEVAEFETWSQFVLESIDLR